MLNLIKKIYRKIIKISSKKTDPGLSDFNRSNPLGGNGERVDIQLNKPVDFELMDMYQKNHWKRYAFAKQVIGENDICGDFACGTGYGSVLVSDKAASVTGVDLNAAVIGEIKKRYSAYKNVRFLSANLLDLSYVGHFDTIISFETLEHFYETDVVKLLHIFSKALKDGGRLVFSTPYMQEQSEQAIKMGFHLTFYINEDKISTWLNNAGLQIESVSYQNYDTHVIEKELEKKEFIICVARKRSEYA